MTTSKLVSESFPSAIDFGFSTVDQLNTRTFTLTNHTRTPLTFSFDACAFNFEPHQGVIAPRSSQDIAITFRPREAVVVIANSVLYVADEPPRVIKLSAIGKYPYINLSIPKLDFEYLLIGKKTTKDLIIKNVSQVPAKFEIRKVEEDSFKDSSFSFNIKTGEIAPQASFLVKVTYEPKVVFLESVVHFEVVCHGGNNVPFQCRGSATGFETQLTPDSINFGEINLGHTTSRELILHNYSDLPTSFQLFNDKKNVFSLTPTSGVINAASSVRIIATFNPKVTMNYYERAFCLIMNHQVLYVDLLGTCKDLLVRPKPILQDQVNLFRRRVIKGEYDPTDMVSIMPKDGSKANRTSAMTIIKMQQGSHSPGSDISIDRVGQVEDSVMEIPSENANQVVMHKELFLELNSQDRLISINVSANFISCYLSI